MATTFTTFVAELRRDFESVSAWPVCSGNLVRQLGSSTGISETPIKSGPDRRRFAA